MGRESSLLSAKMCRNGLVRQVQRLQCYIVLAIESAVMTVRIRWSAAKPVQPDGADVLRDATKTPVSTSAKPTTWNSCGRSPRKKIAVTDPNTGTTWKNGA